MQLDSESPEILIQYHRDGSMTRYIKDYCGMDYYIQDIPPLEVHHYFGDKRVLTFKDAKAFVRQNSTCRYIIEPPYTIAVVGLNNIPPDFVNTGRVMMGKGLSICSRNDKWDEQMGKNIARGRAEAELARKVMRLDNFYNWVMNNEDNTGNTAVTTSGRK